jgi:tetratricopeptide (TPR) repeat protein
MLALRAHVPADGTERAERQKWLHTLSVFVGSLGRYRLSRQIVEELLLEPPDPSLVVPVLVQAAVCWHWLGSGDSSLAFLLQAESHTGPDDHRERAWIFHERASTLASMGRHDEAEAAFEVTVREYEAAGDEHGVSRAMGSRVRLAAEKGDWKTALDAAREAREHAQQRGFARLVTMRTIDIGRTLTELGDAASGLAALNEALQQAVAASDDVGRFFVHYYLAKALEAAGEVERAAVERRNAEYYVRFVDAQASEAVEVRRAAGQGGTAAPRAMRPTRARGRGAGRRSR